MSRFISSVLLLCVVPHAFGLQGISSMGIAASGSVSQHKLMRREQKETKHVDAQKADIVPPQLHYRICHGHSGELGTGKCLEDSAGVLKQHTGTAETWTFEKVETAGGTKYHTIKSHGNHYLSSGPSLVSSASGDGTKWEIVQDGSYVRLKNKGGSYLEGHSTTPSQWCCEHNDGLWSALPRTTGNNLLQSEGDVGRMAATGKQDEKKEQGEKDENDAQSTPPPLYFRVCHGHSGTVGSGKCLEDSGGSLALHTGVAETFQFDKVLETGGVKWHTIKSHGGRYLKASGSSLSLASSDTDDKTKWQIVWDGSYMRFYNKDTDKYMEGHSASPTLYNSEHNDGLWSAEPQTSGNHL